MSPVGSRWSVEVDKGKAPSSIALSGRGSNENGQRLFCHNGAGLASAALQGAQEQQRGTNECGSVIDVRT
jgi:hypothetical protein